jgi:2,4-dienoyl-CoA reductase-like NADH-dependent reductase (Old Yellow Enzyme family)
MGTHVEDAIIFSQKLQEAGVDILDVSGGMCGSEPRQLSQMKGYFIPQAEAVKRAVTVPVVGVGGIAEPEFADQLVREGKVDLVAVGRALLHDNEWAQKAIQALSR